MGKVLKRNVLIYEMTGFLLFPDKTAAEESGRPAIDHHRGGFLQGMPAADGIKGLRWAVW